LIRKNNGTKIAQLEGTLYISNHYLFLHKQIETLHYDVYYPMNPWHITSAKLKFIASTEGAGSVPAIRGII
jgi:hypothetical protein